MRKREKLAGLDDDTPHKKLDKFSPNCWIATKSHCPYGRLINTLTGN